MSEKEKKFNQGATESGVTEAEDGPERAAWGGQIEFILTCVGYAVGLGNVWRFPYLCYKNGGGAFLIPYICMLAFVGLPLFYMELCIGQFASLGPLAVWKFSPIFKGIGFASVMVSLFIGIYYNVIISICILFFFKSMTSVLPWTDCKNAWNTNTCLTLQAVVDIKKNETGNMSFPNFTITTPSEEFFYREILHITDNMGEPGGMQWELAGCLLLAWVIVSLVLIKGISSLGKVVYFTALFPYVLLTILLVRGALLDGSLEGVIYYLKPEWGKLLEAQVWSDAAVQIFYSLGVASGGLMAMASYNNFNNNVLRDSMIVPIVNCGTSIYAGFVIFSILGYMAKAKGVDIADVAAQGPGLTFVVYPEALSTMPLPPLWACLFFFMMITLGFSSEFSMMETVMTALLDEFPHILKTSRKREIMFRVGTCFICFLLGLPMVTHGGFYVLTLLDNYVGGFPPVIVGICELIAINWVYGFRRFNDDIEMMLGRRAPLFFNVMWVVISPLLMAVTVVFTAFQYQPITFYGWTYTSGYSALGWLTAAFIVAFIPVVALVTCCRNGGYTVLKKISNPDKDWGPAHAGDRTGTKYERDTEMESATSNEYSTTGQDNEAYDDPPYQPPTITYPKPTPSPPEYSEISNL